MALNEALLRRQQELKDDPSIAAAIGRLGGSVSSADKILARRLQWLKKNQKWDNDDMEFFVQTLQDPTADIMMLKNFLLDIRKNTIDKEIKLKADKLLIDLHKAHFGDKKNVNISGSLGVVNINITPAQVNPNGPGA
jgi:hypothetical protein